MRPITILTFLLLSLRAVSQTPSYQVYALKFASDIHPFPISLWVDKGPKNDSVNIDFMIWLIKGNNGKNILVDAGFLPGLEEAKEFDIGNYIRPDSTLQKLGLKADDITDIILSHPHWDHIDGIGVFPNAHIWIQKEDYNYYVGGAWQKGGMSGGFAKRDVHQLVDLNMAGRVTLVDGDNKEIIPGVKVFTGSRHTYNSQFVLVQTGKNKVILASDNIWVYYSLDHLLPASQGGTFDNTGYVNSMRRMKTLVSNPKYIVPGHDAQIFTGFPKVAEGVVKIE
ncbi:MAG: N-acyl homoserine lactonase family protein [Bacteroidetes bacterium]|nr:N-acyl homoserine lactonase family protein [Bacteroidota bacterium]